MSKENFLGDLAKATNYTHTANGAVTHETSFNALLDFFGQAGAMRGRDAAVIDLFEKAYMEDNLRALKCVFYFGDILEGQGERDTFRTLLKHIANKHKDILKNNIHLIPEFNRWDSIYALFDTDLEDDVINLVRNQIKIDLSSEHPSLCAKWLKSTTSSSPQTRKLGKKTARLLNLTDAENKKNNKAKKANEYMYRKTLTNLRTKLRVVEKNMSNNEWNSIDYSKVPSRAMNIYNNSFLNHDETRFTEYVDDLVQNKVKVNSKALYPYEIVKKVFNHKNTNIIEEKLMQAQWNSLPNYIVNPDMKGICVVDVSGSMDGTPLEVAVSTALYVSERCSGTYHNKFITFSEHPKLVSVKGDNIIAKVKNMSRADWDMNTNLEAVFDLILQTAIKNKSPQEDIPDYLIILTDMEFDEAIGNDDYYCDNKNRNNFNKETLIETLRKKYEEAGYDLPILVLWNIDAKSGQMPMTADEYGWISVSGYSPTIFKALLSEELLGAQELNKKSIDPIKAMLTVLDSERYNAITIE